MFAPSLRWRLFLLKYDRLSPVVGSRMENDTQRASKRKTWRISPTTVAFVLVGLLLVGQWYDGHRRIDALREELAQRVRESESDSRDARLSARQAQEAAREVQAKLAQIELKFAEFQNQQVGLEALYQELSRSRDEWVIAEIEQILTIASQQLQLTGNVQGALAALQAAEARLARSGRPQFLPLRKVFARDIERLKTAPGLDVPGMAVKLDQLIAGVDSLPLVQEARPQATAVAKREAVGLWERLVAELLGELKQLVRIQNMEASDPALLSPPQAFFLRENLKLRLLNARLALLARDETTYRSDLKMAVSWLERYFDTRSRAAAAMAVALKQLGSGGIGVSLPTIGESLAAVRAYALFVVHPWRAEIWLNLLAVLLILVFAAGYFLLRVVWHALRLPSPVRAFRERRRDEKGRAAALGAIQALYEGQFVRAEKLASGAAELGAAPGLASLLAARAAQKLRQFGRRDQWLERAKEGDGEWRLARLMTAAELLLEERRFLEARAVLRELNAGRPRHVAALLLSLRAEQGMANWDEVLRLANLLEKRDAMPPEALDSVRVNARVAILSRKTDREGLARHWDDTPRSERLRPKIAAAAARAFIELGDCRKAHRIIEEALEKNWDGALALLYGECTDEDAFERLERAERWLRERPGEAELLLTLGRLCVQRELWGKAQSYLEASLATQPTEAAHVALARLFERIGRTEEANRHFRASADLGPARRALD